ERRGDQGPLRPYFQGLTPMANSEWRLANSEGVARVRSLFATRYSLFAGRVDLSWPVLILFAAVLCMLVVLPISRLFYFSFVDRSGAFTLDNFARLVVDDTFTDP